jgi:hypothetical protein
MRTVTVTGWLKVGDYGEAMDVLQIGDPATHEWKPLAEALQDDIAGHTVTVRYWVTGKAMTRDEAAEAFLRTLYGAADALYVDRYSETTGYLWTDEKLQVVGHDLIEELSGSAGKFLIFEADVHA